MLLRNRFPSHPMYGFDDQTISNMENEAGINTIEKNERERIANQNRHLNATPGVPLGHFYPPGGSLPPGLLAEEITPSGPIPVTMPNWEEQLPNVLHQLADNPYGPQGMQNQKELDLVRYETEGPETANLQLTPPELARRARLQAEIDRELVDPNFVSQVDQMKQDALAAENQRMLVGGPPSYDPELEQMMLREGIFNRVSDTDYPRFSAPDHAQMGRHITKSDRSDPNFFSPFGGLTGSPEGLREEIALREAQQPQSLLDTNMGEGVGGKYTDNPTFRRDRRKDLLAKFLFNTGRDYKSNENPEWIGN